MSSPETLSDSTAERDRGVTDRAQSLLEPVAPELARQAESGNLAAASGVVSLVRAGRTFLKGNRKRGALQALGGLFWVAVALAQRRSGGSRGPGESRGPGGGDALGGSRSGDELTEVVDTSPDVDEAVEPGERETDHATGEEVVDTTDADLEASETDDSTEISQDEVDDAEVDQRDVAGSSDMAGSDDVTDSDEAADRDEEHEFSESGDAEQAETGDDSESEIDGDAGDEAGENAETEADEDAETEIGESEEAALGEAEESETAE